MRVRALAAVFLVVLIGGAAPTSAAKVARAPLILLAAGDIGDFRGGVGRPGIRDDDFAEQPGGLASGAPPGADAASGA